MKVAIVHPWFWELGGGEKVIEAFASMFPQADIFVLATLPDGIPASLAGRNIKTSFLNRIPGIRWLRKPLIALYPTAIESFDLEQYDLVISSAGPVTCGVAVAQHAVHICYVHSPGRSVWDAYAERQRSLSPFGKFVYTAINTYVRTWEFSAAQRVDYFVCNSNYIANRVQKYFRRDSTTIYPGVDTSRGFLASRTGDYYLTLGRLGERKRIDLLIEACNRLERRLVVAGSGPEEVRLRAIAGPTIEFAGRVMDSEVAPLLAGCRAFLFAADEDFGIAPVEAQSCGRPVIAYGHGGVLETVRVNDVAGRSDTGVFFPEQTVESVIDGIQRFEEIEDRFIPSEIRAHAERFSRNSFMYQMDSFITSAMRDRT